MDTITYRGPRPSRVKALIAALLATLAIAGTVQVANPAPAAAAKATAGYCNSILSLIELADSLGLTSAGNALWLHHNKVCSGAPW